MRYKASFERLPKTNTLDFKQAPLDVQIKAICAESSSVEEAVRAAHEAGIGLDEYSPEEVKAMVEQAYEEENNPELLETLTHTAQYLREEGYIKLASKIERVISKVAVWEGIEEIIGVKKEPKLLGEEEAIPREEIVVSEDEEEDII